MFRSGYCGTASATHMAILEKVELSGYNVIITNASKSLPAVVIQYIVKKLYGFDVIQADAPYSVKYN